MSDIPLTDRDILIRMDTKVDMLMDRMPALENRVRSLEEDRAELRGQAKTLKSLTYVGGGVGLAGFLSAIAHWFHWGPKP